MVMRKIQKIAAVVIVALGLVTAYGLLVTRETQQALPANNGKQPGRPVVVLKPLKTAQQLAQLATTHEEQALAQEALRLADYDVDLAFDEAIRDARLHPPPPSQEAVAAKARVEKSEKALEEAQENAKRLSELLVKASGDIEAAIESDLIQAEADIDLAQDEVDDAKHDLQTAGGDSVARLNAMKKAHEDAAKDSAKAIPTAVETDIPLGLIFHVAQWWRLHQKQMQLWQAKGETEYYQARLKTRHDTMDAEIDAKKVEIAELSKQQKTVESETGGRASKESADLLKKTQDLGDEQKIVSTFDKRIEAKKELAAVYGQWIELVAGRQKTVLHRALLGVVVILVIALIGLYFSSWLDSLVARISMDRRQVESLRTVVRLASQIAALFLIALVILGLPGQLGTFLGLAGAGLTVALKDFIVGFIGWFVLMGKNGMRLGDWVEINGVTGEVVQIGPFHTVLLETGNWTDSGHPTGRRVTFTNSFAIEGHYFNFSTSGQWLWDELQVVLPSSQDPYPALEAIQKKVEELTSRSAQEAETEWKSASGSRGLASISMTPVVNVRPVLGGTQVSVRYVTRASERSDLRTKLNQAAVQLLGEGRSKKEVTR
jgi:small-conductance mechanosensitive channel